MRMIRSLGTAMAAVATLAACVPRTPPPAPRAAPVPQPVPPPPAPAPPAPPAPPVAWQDGPLAPGDWSYTGQGAIPEATFASPGGALFAMRCEPGGQIRFLVLGAAGGSVTITTSFGERTLPGSGNENQTMAVLAASDPLFDELASSRGRFLVRVAGWANLVLPTWPEPARVIEDCRGQ